MSPEKSKEVETSRLRLRCFTSEDLGAYATIMGDDRVGRGFPKGTGYTREEAKRSLDAIMTHWKKYGFGIWAITDKHVGTLIGRCGLNLITDTSEVEVDFVTAPNYWGRGYATEAAKASLEYGFTILGLKRIIALTKPDNAASRRVMEKIGMHFVKNAQYWGISCAYYERLPNPRSSPSALK